MQDNDRDCRSKRNYDNEQHGSQGPRASPCKRSFIRSGLAREEQRVLRFLLPQNEVGGFLGNT